MATQGVANVVKITSLDEPELIELARDTQKTPAFMGPPGIGKTAGCDEFAVNEAKRLELPLELNPKAESWDEDKTYNVQVVLTSRIESIDAGGMPTIRMKANGERVTDYVKSILIPMNGRGMLLFDEFSNGDTHVMASLQDFILTRRINGQKISDGITIVLAMNRQQDNCGCNFIPFAMRNRVAWYEVTKPKTELVLEKLKQIGRAIHPKLTGWIVSVGGKYVEGFDPKSETYAYGTLRSMEQASIQLTAVDKKYKTLNLPMYYKVVGGWMGEAAGNDFVAFLKLAEKVDLRELMDKPELIKRYSIGDKADPGLLYSICVNLIEYACKEESADRVFGVLRQLDRMEYGVFIVNSMIREIGDTKTVRLLQISKNAQPLLSKYTKLVEGRERD